MGDKQLKAMKAVILCGGRGTRLGEHGRTLPKALFPIGGKPIIWHLLKIYSSYGMNDFVLCLGYLGDLIREYVGSLEENWAITCIDTGTDTNTGGRIKLIEDQLAGADRFCVTYGDGLADVNIGNLIDFHRSHGKAATVTAVHPHSNFGLMELDAAGTVTGFREKPVLKEWVNGGFFVFEKRVLSYLDETSILEREPFESLCSDGEMMAFRHEGFWKCMDTFKDNLEFEQLWATEAAWKVW